MEIEHEDYESWLAGAVDSLHSGAPYVAMVRYDVNDVVSNVSVCATDPSFAAELYALLQKWEARAKANRN